MASKIIKATIFVCFSFFIGLISGCGASPEKEDIVGSFYSDYGEKLEFKGDGTYIGTFLHADDFFLSAKKDQKVCQEGIWKFEITNGIRVRLEAKKTYVCNNPNEKLNEMSGVFPLEVGGSKKSCYLHLWSETRSSEVFYFKK